MRKTGLRWLWITALVLVIDHVTKQFILHSLVLGDIWPIVPGLNFTLAYNTGAAFSFLNTASGWQSWLFGSLAVIVSLSLIIWLKKLASYQAWTAIALTFIIGGALGNLWDRISHGHVIDFIDLYLYSLHWPVFNIADSAICLGGLMLLREAISNSKHPE